LSNLPQIDLAEGYWISRLIKGGWQLAGDHGEVEPARAIADMLAFFDAGFLAYDCADIYTGVEDMLGQFLASLKQKRGAEAAASVKIHTKCVPDMGLLGRLQKSDLASTIDRSLHRLGRERLDLVQFHWWDYDQPGWQEAIVWLNELRRDGKIDRLGVTNFDGAHLAALGRLAPITSAQVQFSLLDRRPVHDMAATAAAQQTHLLAYGVLAGGFFAESWLGQADPGFQFANRSLIKYRLIIEEFGGWDLFQTLLETLARLAGKHQGDIASVTIRAMLDEAAVSAAIIGARYANRLDKTLRALSIQLEDEDHAALAAVLAQASGPSGPVYGLERDRSGLHGRIMKYNLNQGDQSVAAEKGLVE
jgi:aryl-alcohol dehydrogenase-like predicted oxidoreductase